MIEDSIRKYLLESNLTNEESSIILEKYDQVKSRNEVKAIIEVLKENNLLNILSKCSNILVRGKSTEIESIIKTLKENNMLPLLEKCPTILARGRNKEIKEVIKTLKENNLTHLLEKCSYILSFGKSSEIKLIINILKENNLVFILEKCPTILAKGKGEEIESIIEILKENNLLFLLNQASSILYLGKSSDIKPIIKLLKANDLFFIVEKSPTVLATGRSREIELIIDTLKVNNLLPILKKCPSILAKSKSSEINTIIKILNTNNLLSLVEKCPTVLATGKSKEIESIIDTLKVNNLISSLKHCPSILKKRKNRDVEKIIEILKENNLSQVLINCPTVLAEAKSSELKKIIETLKLNNLSSVLETSSIILAFGKNKDIKTIIEMVKKIKGDLKKLPPYLFLHQERVKEIITLDKDSIDYYQNIKIYLNLIGKYNITISKQELIKLTTILDLDYDEFFERIICRSETYKNYLKETLEKQSYVWLGSSTSITSEIISKYGNKIYETSSKVAKIFTKDNRNIPYEIVYDYALDKTINNCGDIFINYGPTPILERVLINYLKKCCKALYLIKPEQDYEKYSNNKYLLKYDDSDNSFIEKYSYLTEYEQLILLKISESIESGYDFMKVLEKEFGLEFEELSEIIDLIKEKIKMNQLKDTKVKKKQLH